MFKKGKIHAFLFFPTHKSFYPLIRKEYGDCPPPPSPARAPMVMIDLIFASNIKRIQAI